MTTRSVRHFHFATILIAALTLLALVFALDRIENYSPQNRSLQIYLPSDDSQRQYSVAVVLHNFEKKKIVKFILKGNDEDGVLIDHIRSYTSRVKYACDSTIVIKLHWDDNLSYGRLVNLFDIMIYDVHKRWMLLDNDLYIYPYDPSYCEDEHPEG